MDEFIIFYNLEHWHISKEGNRCFEEGNLHVQYNMRERICSVWPSSASVSPLIDLEGTNHHEREAQGLRLSIPKNKGDVLFVNGLTWEFFKTKKGFEHDDAALKTFATWAILLGVCCIPTLHGTYVKAAQLNNNQPFFVVEQVDQQLGPSRKGWARGTLSYS